MTSALKISNAFEIHGRHEVIAELKHSDDIGAYFAQLKLGLLDWRAQLPKNANAQMLLVTNCYRPKAEQLAFAQRLCAAWNADPAVREDVRLNLEVHIGTNALTTYCCTTFVDVREKTGHQLMRVIDLQAMFEVRNKARDKAPQEQEAAEREARRANPVTAPAFVPPWIAWHVASYLRLEYGESFFSADGLKPWQLKRLGEYLVDGVPTIYWQYPTSDKVPHYAIVQRFSSHYALSMTDEPPPVEP